VKARGALRAHSGKGSPKDIFDEVQSITIKAHTDLSSISNESLKKLLTDNNLGIDCSGFAYYILNAESEEQGKGKIDKHISFVNCRSLVGKIPQFVGAQPKDPQAQEARSASQSKAGGLTPAIRHLQQAERHLGRPREHGFGREHGRSTAIAFVFALIVSEHDWCGA